MDRMENGARTEMEKWEVFTPPTIQDQEVLDEAKAIVKAVEESINSGGDFPELRDGMVYLRNPIKKEIRIGFPRHDEGYFFYHQLKWQERVQFAEAIFNLGETLK